MSQIRPLQAADIPAVAGLFQRTFRDGGKPPPPALETYLRWHYLEGPVCDPEMASLVHIASEGDISGFVGVNVLPMRHGQRKLRAAICGSLMVEPQANDPMAGARLLRTFLAGPQDISLSETANALSTQMWTKLRGVALPQYSLDWIRVIRPSAFLLDLASRRADAVRLLDPLARGLDRYLRGRMQENEMRWSGVPEFWNGQGGLKVAEIDHSGFAALLDPLTRQFPLRPDWSAEQLAHILAEASQKPDYGEAVFASVSSPSGALVGAFLYHTRPGRMARVLQVLALPGQAGSVVDCLIGDAARRGAAGLRGRTQPALLAAMLGRRVAFIQPASTVVHSRDEELVNAFLTSQGFFNGLAGEHWNRLAGERFE
ncbi:hypothetical protein ASD99_29775 [Mesorhizobium sp. Root695]|uniref:hypothetical protein n=1 Tax=Mesorhizobium sp. Root695 TaxID=1736589 RepID=UPI00071126E3|nr:hypothetical protein [Mesorhizobium sp. Root695]KRB23867.1 hypothetical protein ASD99_29775 [Mesorhizobium sp. Root695]